MAPDTLHENTFPMDGLFTIAWKPSSGICSEACHGHRLRVRDRKFQKMPASDLPENCATTLLTRFESFCLEKIWKLKNHAATHSSIYARLFLVTASKSHLFVGLPRGCMFSTCCHLAGTRWSAVTIPPMR